MTQPRHPDVPTNMPNPNPSPANPIQPIIPSPNEQPAEKLPEVIPGYDPEKPRQDQTEQPQRYVPSDEKKNSPLNKKKDK